MLVHLKLNSSKFDSSTQSSLATSIESIIEKFGKKVLLFKIS